MLKLTYFLVMFRLLSTENPFRGNNPMDCCQGITFSFYSNLIKAMHKKLFSDEAFKTMKG
jgi:hypothetical protein